MEHCGAESLFVTQPSETANHTRIIFHGVWGVERMRRPPDVALLQDYGAEQPSENCVRFSLLDGLQGFQNRPITSKLRLEPSVAL
jgi:hypothetical protein